MIGKLVGWLAGAARKVNRSNAEMRNPDVRGRFSGPGSPPEPGYRRRREGSSGELDGGGSDPGKPLEESGEGRSE